MVTGASSGIGRELAYRIGEAGLNLILVARRGDVLLDLKKDLENSQRIRCLVLALDLSKDRALPELERAVEGIDVGLLVAAAGFGTSGGFTGNPLEPELEMLQVNCAALLRLTHFFARRFSKRGRGGIILMSSMVAFQGVPFAAHYAASKAYVQCLGEALHHELKPAGVDVLAAAPGPVHSGFADRAKMRLGMALQPSQIAWPILDALGRKMTVLPGTFTKLLIYSLRTVPRWGKVRIMKGVMGGMTRHQAPPEGS